MGNKNKIELYDQVCHPDIYHGNETFLVVGLRVKPDQVELEGDWSGGTHNVCQRDWHKLEGTIIVKKHGRKSK
jgi:hypothetical protein